MALIRMKDLRAMRPEDVRAKFKELSDELMHERGIAAMGGAPASPGKIRALRTNIARIHTVMREQELAKRKGPAETTASKAPGERRKRETRSAPRPKRKESGRRRTAASGPTGQHEEEKK